MSDHPRRQLTPTDRALWRSVTRGVRPLPGSRWPAASPGEDGAPPVAKAPAAQQPQVRPGHPARPAGEAAPERVTVRPAGSRLPRVTLHLAPPAADALDEVGLDGRTFRRLKRGELAPEARLDLHGMSADRAHPALERFIGSALARGLRLVLVITGKGGARIGPHPRDPFVLPPPGYLRRKAPFWLRAGPYRDDIAGMFPAHPRHGGAGAFYVYLKKRR